MPPFGVLDPFSVQNGQLGGYEPAVQRALVLHALWEGLPDGARSGSRFRTCCA